MRPADEWDPAATLLTAFGAGIATTVALAATGGTRRLDTDLVLYVILAGLTALTARWWAAFTSAAMLWCFYSGFLVGRHGVISWHGLIDAWRLGIILTGAAGGWLIHRVVRFTAGVLPADLNALRQADEAEHRKTLGP